MALLIQLDVVQGKGDVIGDLGEQRRLFFHVHGGEIGADVGRQYAIDPAGVLHADRHAPAGHVFPPHRAVRAQRFRLGGDDDAGLRQRPLDASR
ncbi:MAG: hypothetical protein M5R40_04700 [Anaerolineae bacterium]|nr:hypothetical protein [Anaerolineae bacterium]